MAALAETRALTYDAMIDQLMKEIGVTDEATLTGLTDKLLKPFIVSVAPEPDPDAARQATATVDVLKAMVANLEKNMRRLARPWQSNATRRPYRR